MVVAQKKEINRRKKGELDIDFDIIFFAPAIYSSILVRAFFRRGDSVFTFSRTVWDWFSFSVFYPAPTLPISRLSFFFFHPISESGRIAADTFLFLKWASAVLMDFGNPLFTFLFVSPLLFL